MVTIFTNIRDNYCSFSFLSYSDAIFSFQKTMTPIGNHNYPIDGLKRIDNIRTSEKNRNRGRAKSINQVYPIDKLRRKCVGDIMKRPILHLSKYIPHPAIVVRKELSPGAIRVMIEAALMFHLLPPPSPRTTFICHSFRIQTVKRLASTF